MIEVIAFITAHNRVVNRSREALPDAPTVATCDGLRRRAGGALRRLADRL